MSGGKLPEGWATAPVSTVTTLIRGVTYKKEQALNYLQDDYLPLIRANNIQNGKFDTTDLVFVPKNLVKESQKISPEDIVIAMSSGSKSVVGKSAHQRLPFECSFGAFCGALRPEKHISPSFIAHFTKSSFYRNKISSLSAGANINNIKPASFDLINIPIPSFTEQKIIAEKLDTLLAQVDSTKARLEQIPQILKRFRQAVLAMVLNGSSEQSRNTAKIVKLIDVTKKITDGEHLTPKTINSGIPLLSAKDVQEDELLFDNVKYLSDTVAAKALNRCNPERNDILIVSRGATVGRTHLVSTSKTFCLMGSVLLIKLDTEKVMPEYMKLIFNDISGQQQLVSASGATAQQAIYIRDVKEFSFKLVSLHEQHEIVRRVEQLFTYADTIDKQVNSALTRVNNLTQSILAKAFRGELTAQWRAENPSLISGENSATAMLERIKAERATSSGKKSSRKKA
ncbi:type I restriction-modification system [Klebsiella pneumoniae subsp. ozaenae]|uniref:Type I restriction-modification system n=3 Tax=Klebsiella pneumoniae TaxID=573 RepID=A0A378AV53_KLEPO|nr:restriction endonuclease subunit S [Klebsiella pneumoniae]STV22146.1 type I restriction-modification system [Klebsiella pneumoniae subsp. ozaenae]AYJ95487.1 restriction endonuclease subunit S [Klebsiella pneumoniae]STT57985.1 type I restriction-modification system [Klebsiella pneumoniae]STU25344.1 type I restriction-modification system [Klebsiella pneumoniae]STU32831.1 type I restriction-modification system [Klebsiella pneumoniae]